MTTADETATALSAALAVLAAVVVTAAGCSFGGDQVIPLEGQRLEDYRAADGREADPSQFEIDELDCTANADEDDRIDVAFTVTNTATTERLFEVEVQLRRSDGGWEARRREVVERYLVPGESIQRETWVVLGDDPATELDCRLVVYDSPLEVFDS